MSNKYKVYPRSKVEKLVIDFIEEHKIYAQYGKDYELNFVLKQETEWELGIIYQAQKSMDYFEEEY